MSYLSRPDSWEKHQRLEISRFVASYIGGGYTDRDFVPLYPGSMLFNQIALADNGCSLQSAVYDQPRIESLDAVYEALAYSTNPIVTAESLLIDCQSWWDGIDSILRDRIEKHCMQYPEHGGVVVLSGRYSSRIKRLCDEASVMCRVIRPRWWSAASLLYLYRSSAHVLFVDTTRSLDAAMVGVACSLVVGSDYARQPLFSALHAALSHCTCCCVTMSSSVDSVLRDSLRIIVIENTYGALIAKMDSENMVLSDNRTDVTRDSDPVIRTGVYWQQRWKHQIANTRVSVRRKTRKLIEDPRAFFRDSKLPCSGAIAAFLPDVSPSSDAQLKSQRR